MKSIPFVWCAERGNNRRAFAKDKTDYAVSDAYLEVGITNDTLSCSKKIAEYYDSDTP